MLNIQDLLIREAGLAAADVEKALALAKAQNLSLMQAVEYLNVWEEDKMLEWFAQYYRVHRVNLAKMDIHAGVIELIPKDIAQKYKVIPIDKAGNNIIIATSHPQNLEAVDTIRFKCGYVAKPVLASDARIQEALEKYYGKMDVSSLVASSVGSSKASGGGSQRISIASGYAADKEDGPIIKLVNDVLLKCMSSGASDIHMEPYEEFLRIRLRIDGELVEIIRPPIGMRNALISRIKIMAGLNIAETRLPQDGAINITVGEKPVDFRVNSLPTVYGEKIVMRILDKSNLQVDMTQLGFEQDQLKLFKSSIYSPFGMVLVTGPTGSGKTTTLYSALQELNQEDVNIMTAEDPVEYSLPGVNQVQMKSEIGLNFAASLRAFLRQDPDVIMVGEIRETAEIGIKAALTGHMVLSTLHTNSAPDTISRLLNMGVANFNLVSALKCITAQRLMRKICLRCKEIDEEVTSEILVNLGVNPVHVSKIKVFKGKGCAVCAQSGSKGRIAVHEILILNEEVKKSILRGDPALEIKKVAMHAGMRTLRQSAIMKMAYGICSIQEVIKSTSSDKDDVVL
jgi:type IV pilus assembly protein PilB